MQLKAALEAQRYVFSLFYVHMLTKMYFRQLVAHMMEKDKASIAQPSSDSSSSSCPSSSSESCPPSAINAPPASRLIILDSPPPCYQEDYEDVQFWTQAEWTQYEHKKREKGDRFHKLRFISQENGSMVDNARLSAIGKEATELWNTLYHTCDDPPSWKSKTKIASEYFSNSMPSNSKNFDGVRATGKLKHLLPTISQTGVDGHKAQGSYLVRYIFLLLACSLCLSRCTSFLRW